MSKTRLYIPKEHIDNILTIKDKSLLHKIKDVLNLKKGEFIFIFDGHGNEYLYKINEIRHGYIIIAKEKDKKVNDSLNGRITLAIPLIKEQRMDFILQKATELGVWEFKPFVCERSIKNSPSTTKIKRWERIVQEAARQSQRLWIPKIEEVFPFEKIINQDFAVKLAASINGESIETTPYIEKQEILLIIGPEGDFSPAEYSALSKNDFRFIKLSDNILRVETASMFAVGLISYLLKQHMPKL